MQRVYSNQFRIRPSASAKEARDAAWTRMISWARSQPPAETGVPKDAPSFESPGFSFDTKRVHGGTASLGGRTLTHRDAQDERLTWRHQVLLARHGDAVEFDISSNVGYGERVVNPVRVAPRAPRLVADLYRAFRCRTGPLPMDGVARGDGGMTRPARHPDGLPTAGSRHRAISHGDEACP